MRRYLILSLLLFVSCTVTNEQSENKLEAKQNVETETKQANADKAIVRLSPGEFTDLPKEIIADLEKRDCTIPQTYMSDEKHNVIEGEFKNKGQQDIAVLCSIDKASAILVYWNKTTEDVAEIEKSDDKGFLQTIGNGKTGFSRAIETVDAKYINDRYKSFGGPKPPEITHQAINESIAEKASTVRYFDGAKWLALQGAD